SPSSHAFARRRPLVSSSSRSPWSTTPVTSLRANGWTERLSVRCSSRSERRTRPFCGGCRAATSCRPLSRAGTIGAGTSPIPESSSTPAASLCSSKERLSAGSGQAAGPQPTTQSALPERPVAGIQLVGDRHRIADGDRAAVEDVRTEPAAVDERSQQSGTCEFLEMRTRLGEPPPDALDLPDRGAVADARIHCDPPRGHDSGRVLAREVDGVETLRLDERQLVATSGPAEGPAAAVVAISRQPVSGDRVNAIDAGEWAFRVRSCQEPDHRPHTTILSVRLVE